MTTADELKAARDHPAWEQLDQLLDRARAASPRSASDRETIARLIAVAQYVKRFRSSSLRLSPGDRLISLDNTFNEVNQLINYLDGWDQSGAMPGSTVAGIDRYTDEILVNVRDWPALPKSEGAQAAEAADEAARLTTAAALDALLADVLEAQARLDEIRQELNEAELRATSVAAEASNALEQLTEALEANADDARMQRESDSAEAADSAKAQRAQIAARAEHDRLHVNAETEALIEALKKDKETATKLLAFVSDGTVSGGYGKYAKSESNAYRLWNGLGVLTAAGGIAYLAWHFQDISGLDLSVTITRAALSIPIFGFTAFAFRQANHRHRNAVDATYRALDLLALPPFTNDMPDEDRSQLRMIMGQRIFSRVPDTGDKKADGEATVTPETITSLTALLKALQSAIR